MRYSHTSTQMYQQCPRKFKHHYIDGLRPETINASLLFGSAFDSAVNEVLIDTQKNQLAELGKYNTLFLSKWETQPINGTVVDLKKSNLVIYSNYDCDVDLLDERFEGISELIKKKKQSGYSSLSAKELDFFSEASWESLKVKGLVLLKTYYNKVLPLIESITQVQLQVKADNGSGDELVAYIDWVGRLKGQTEDCIFDNKTSSMDYDYNAVQISPQLALYSELTGINKSGFIVLSKGLKKIKTKVCDLCGEDGTGSRAKTCDSTKEGARCKGNWIVTLTLDSEPQVIVGEISPHFRNVVLENFEEIDKLVKTGSFPRSLNQGSCLAYGSKCTFYNMCYNNSDAGLFKKSEGGKVVW